MSEQYILPGLDDGLDRDVSHRPLMAFPRQADQPACSVKRLWLRNLKGFEELEVKFSDFNVLVGPNNCGKSTLLQAIDLCFRLIQYHVEFQKGFLTKPRAGKRIIEEMLPVAIPEDFWFERRIRVGNERIPVVIGVELQGDYQFEFEIKRQWGGLNSRMTRLPEGLAEGTMRAILARRPTLIPSSFGVVKREEFRTPARVEILSLTGHHNEVLRNHLRDLLVKSPEVYEGLQHDLQRHFDGTIGKVEFSFDEDQYITVAYQEGEHEHDVFSAGGGFLQVLQVLTYLYLQTPGIVLLDEPDAHLHSSLQKLVVDLLNSLNRQERVQVILATHSKEIINYVDASHILPISRGQKTALSLEHHSSVLPILQDLGAIDNADLAALTASKRCVFVEGRSDKRTLARFAARLNSTVFEGHTQVVTIPMMGVDHPERYVGLDIFESFVGTPIRALIVRDRDGLPDNLVDEIREYVAKQNRAVVVLNKTHIENYLLVPSVIWRVICDKLRQRGAEDLPGLEQIESEIEQAVDSLYDATFDSIAQQINKHHCTYHDKHLDSKQLNQQARAFLGDTWKTLDEKLSFVLGKEALKSIRRRVQEVWGVTFTDGRLIEAMEDNEVDPDIKEIITRLETL
jgi:ABC-type lipoprotein export system ATPase subunit